MCERPLRTMPAVPPNCAHRANTIEMPLDELNQPIMCLPDPRADDSSIAKTRCVLYVVYGLREAASMCTGKTSRYGQD
jgi:hypothetical protein